MPFRLRGLVAAVHTPFHPDGCLDLSAVERQAEHLALRGVAGAFVAGTTGECHSLTVPEKLDLVTRWAEVVRGTTVRLVVHAGANSLEEAKAVAAHAARQGAAAVAAMPPSYFKPASVESLVACCAAVAGAAPGLPFYYYDIPEMTGVRLPMPAFLAAAGPIPNLAGIKFTNSDLMAFLLCLHEQGGRFDILWGKDEALLAALALGAEGGVGSTYNFAAPLYFRLIEAFRGGDLPAARAEQLRSVRLVALLDRFGYMAAAKAVMGMLGVAVGPPRLPHTDLSPDDRAGLRSGLERLGFFDWARG